MTTNKLMGLCTLALTSILLTGCPYTSEVPLSEAGSKVPAGFIGTWEDADNAGDRVEITAGSGNEVAINHITTAEGSEPTEEKYTGHFTDINGTIFLNLKEVSEYSTTYYLYKIEREGDNKIKLFSVTPNIRETFDNSAAMVKFFAANMQNSYFFEAAEVTYYKVK